MESEGTDVFKPDVVVEGDGKKEAVALYMLLNVHRHSHEYSISRARRSKEKKKRERDFKEDVMCGLDKRKPLVRHRLQE